jgi:hypothetical protein
MVMLSNQGTYIAKIVRMLNSSENTVRQWIARFEAKRQMFSMMNFATETIEGFTGPPRFHRGGCQKEILQSLGISLASGPLGSCVPRPKQNMASQLVRPRCTTC